ncbi:MAG: hypothetical protein RLZZ517_152 [Candidatus Parcubacteria bacterium]
MSINQLDKKVFSNDNYIMNKSRPEKISWQHYEHVHQEKTIDWFWIVGIIAIGTVVLSVFFHNYLFAIIIILFTALSFIFVTRQPKLLVFEISRKGIRAGNTLYPFSLLDSFWVEDTEYSDKILFKSRKPLSPLIVIPFDSTQTDPELIRDFLLDYLDEEELQEPLHQILMEYFGF